MTVDPDRFRTFELENNLFDLRVDDVAIWERIRFSVLRDIKRQNGMGQAHTVTDRTLRNYLKGSAVFAKNLVYRNPFLSDSTDIMFVGNQRRKKEPDGYWWDIYCDPIHDACEYDYMHFETPHLLQHHRPAKTERLRYLDLIDYGSTIQKLLGMNKPTIPDAVEAKLQMVKARIHEQFDGDVDLIEKVESTLQLRRSTLPLYRRLLSRVDPSIVVLVGGYGKETLIEASQEKEIPVVELQHGVIYEDHFGYSYPGSRTKEAFPDYFLVWGDYWKEVVEYPIPDENVISVGYPYLEKRREQYTDVDPREQILFISQGAIGKQLSKFAVEVEQHPEIEHDIVYKLHPGEYDRWRDEYPWLVDADLEVIDSSEPPLYQLFSESSVQVGVYSTAVYEGLYFGLETHLYHCPDAETLQSLIDDGAATLVSSAGELASRLESQATPFDHEYYFANNATTRTCETLEGLRSQAY